MNNIEKLLTYATIGVVLWITIVILAVYSKNYFFDRLIKLTKEQRKLEKERKGSSSNKKVNPYYKQCRDLFNIQMKNGQLKREKLLAFKDLIDLSLGDKVLYYNNYTFKNDCHEVYCKLKNETLNQLDYEKFIKFLAKN